MRLQFVRDFGTSVFKVPDIYKLKDNSFKRVIPYFFLITAMFVMPLIVSITNMDTFLFSSFGIDIVEETERYTPSNEELYELQLEDNFEVIEYLPKGCRITGGQMVYKEFYDVTYSKTQVVNNEFETETVRLIFNAPDDFKLENNTDYTISFGEYHYELYLKGFKFTLYYNSSFNMDFSDFSNINYTDASCIKEILNFALVGLVRTNAWIINTVLFLIFAAVNFIFVLFIAFCARFLRYRDSNFPEFKEIIKMLIYCSTIPCLIGLILGFFGAFAVSTVLYNFVLPFVAIIVYVKNKQIIKGQMSNREAKQGEYLL